MGEWLAILEKHAVIQASIHNYYKVDNNYMWIRNPYIDGLEKSIQKIIEILEENMGDYVYKPGRAKAS